MTIPRLGPKVSARDRTDARREYSKLRFQTGTTTSKAGAAIDLELAHKVLQQQQGEIPLAELCVAAYVILPMEASSVAGPLCKNNSPAADRSSLLRNPIVATGYASLPATKISGCSAISVSGRSTSPSSVGCVQVEPRPGVAAPNSPLALNLSPASSRQQSRRLSSISSDSGVY
jgi:hypothetical protein